MGYNIFERSADVVQNDGTALVNSEVQIDNGTVKNGGKVDSDGPLGSIDVVSSKNRRNVNSRASVRTKNVESSIRNGDWNIFTGQFKDPVSVSNDFEAFGIDDETEENENSTGGEFSFKSNASKPIKSKYIKRKSDSRNFIISLVPRNTAFVESDESVSIDDYDAIKNAEGIDYEANVVLEVVNNFDGIIKITNLTPEICSFDENQMTLTRIKDGKATIQAQSNSEISLADIQILRENSSLSFEFSGFTDGTFGKAITDAVDDNLVSSEIEMYSDLEGRIRNPSCWASSVVDLSCIDSEKPGACYIGTSNGSSYVVQASHYFSASDKFVAMDGTVEEMFYGQSVDIGSDIKIKRCSSSTFLSSKFIPALLAPANLNDYLPSKSYNYPAMTTDQEKKTLIKDLSSIGVSISYRPPVDSVRLSSSETIIGGDSGSPGFLLIPDNGAYPYRLMFLSSWWGPNSGGFVSYNLDQAMSAIESMGGNSSDFEIADLSSYPTY